MADDVNVKDLVTKRIVKLDKALDTMSAGSKEHVMAVGDYKKLVDAYAALEDKRISEEDNVAKREEQKRVNDNDIEHKAFEDAMNMKRYELEKEYKSNQTKLDFGHLLVESVFSGLAWGTKTVMARRACIQEYGLSGGDSLLPPRNVTNELKGFDSLLVKK